MRSRRTAHHIEELARRHDAPHVSHHRLEDNGRNLGPQPIEGGDKALGVVVLQDQRVLDRAGSHSRRIGNAERGGRTAGGDQQAIDVPMIVAGEFDDDVAARVAACQPNRTHRRFRPRVNQANLFDGRHKLDDQFGNLVFGPGGRAKTSASSHGGQNRVDDRRMSVPQNHRPPGTDVVEIPIAIDIDQPGPFAPFKHDRLATNRSERASRTIHTAWD